MANFVNSACCWGSEFGILWGPLRGWHHLFSGRVTIRAIFPGLLYCFDSKYLEMRFENIRNRVIHRSVCTDEMRYFRQYRNPGQDASWENGTYGHPILRCLVISDHFTITNTECLKRFNCIMLSDAYSLLNLQFVFKAWNSLRKCIDANTSVIGVILCSVCHN